MTDLTKQWNKGKLPEGDYYIKRRNGYLPYDNIDSRGVWRNSIDEDIVEVLAEVPSYELWKAVHEQRNVLFVENTKLKELLKECRDEIEYLRKHYKGKIDHFKNNTWLDKEINQVLQEKEQ